MKCKTCERIFGAIVMPARKMRIELFDNEGNKYNISFEGQVTRDKAIRLLDLVELLGGIPETDHGLGGASGKNPSRFEKVRLIIQRNFPLIWFSSKDIQAAFEQEFKVPISLSTVSTYLLRMTNRGLLLRTGESKNLRYKTLPSIPRTTLKQEIK